MRIIIFTRGGATVAGRAGASTEVRGLGSHH
jgi:hypothetical protein